MPVPRDEAERLPNPRWMPGFLGRVPVGIEHRHLEIVGLVALGLLFLSYFSSLLASVLGSLATRPVSRDTSISFYRLVRPFGVWGPIRGGAGLSAQELAARSENVPLTILNVVLGMVAICGLYLAPMYLVGHWYGKSAAWLAAAVAAVAVLGFTWYRNLPPPSEG